ncbi:hypothetical protein KC19_3G130400 [Ceratodon purpureus]|uniref:Uncharacterized protein n=1 Tax=Ceratodon purpureus TaxID=3225 RepID=A0A8T0IKD9_CERPU|nr:hypothetical protein KC19_3G130400 [Ceratodon purpureus]
MVLSGFRHLSTGLTTRIQIGGRKFKEPFVRNQIYSLPRAVFKFSLTFWNYYGSAEGVWRSYPGRRKVWTGAYHNRENRVVGEESFFERVEAWKHVQAPETECEVVGK